MIPGEYILSEGDVLCNENRKTIKITVKHTGDRPCQIGSHTHFFEVNKTLDFPREQAFGYRLNIPAGTLYDLNLVIPKKLSCANTVE